jgi:hypothetical protein
MVLIIKSYQINTINSVLHIIILVTIHNHYKTINLHYQSDNHNVENNLYNIYKHKII